MRGVSSLLRPQFPFPVKDERVRGVPYVLRFLVFGRPAGPEDSDTQTRRVDPLLPRPYPPSLPRRPGKVPGPVRSGVPGLGGTTRVPTVEPATGGIDGVKSHSGVGTADGRTHSLPPRPTPA